MEDHKFKSVLDKEFSRKEFLMFSLLAIGSVFGFVGLIRELSSHAATATATIEPESGTIAGGDTKAINDTTASGAKAVKFSKTAPSSTPGKTVYGINTMFGPAANTMLQRLGKIPMARCYRSFNSLPNDGSLFAPGGFCYYAAGLQIAGVTSAKRLNLSYGFPASQILNASHPRVQELKAFAASVPAGWYVQLVAQHEYNLSPNRANGTIPDFVRAIKILGQAIYEGDAGRGRAITVINPSGDVGWIDSYAPPANQMPPGTQFHWDIYDQPNGTNGYKGYGHPYRPASSLIDQRIQSVINLGYMNSNYGWGIDELGATQRVAPKLSTFDSRLGWGPSSPYDLDGTGRVATIQGMIDRMISTAAIPPTTIIHFTFNANGSGQWNHSWDSGGRHDRSGVPSDDWYLDSGGNEVRGSHYQNFPIGLPAASTDRMYAMVKGQFNSSPM